MLVCVCPAVKMMGDKNLVLVQEPRHKYLRTLLQPAFSKEAVNSYLPDIQALVEGYIEAWAAAGGNAVTKPWADVLLIHATMGCWLSKLVAGSQLQE